MEKENRDFLFKELAKGNEIIKAYQQILDNISIHGNAYNPFFVLVLDSMTAKLILIISYVFDKNNDSINLKNNMVKSTKNTSWIENLKEEYKDLITFRNKAVGHLNKKTENSLESIRCSDEKLNQSITSFSFSKEVSDKTNFLTCLVSFIEALFYFGLTILFFKEFNFSTENIIHFLQIIGGWLGIKTLGNFGQWADEHLGRASFYLYLIGSLLNLVFSTSIGLCVCYLISIA